VKCAPGYGRPVPTTNREGETDARQMADQIKDGGLMLDDYAY
jgi:hypothetical protein